MKIKSILPEGKRESLRRVIFQSIGIKPRRTFTETRLNLRKATSCGGATYPIFCTHRGMSMQMPLGNCWYLRAMISTHIRKLPDLKSSIWLCLGVEDQNGLKHLLASWDWMLKILSSGTTA